MSDSILLPFSTFVASSLTVREVHVRRVAELKLAFTTFVGC